MIVINWIKGADDVYHCTFCKNPAPWDSRYGQQLYDYCPSCGGKMREVVEDAFELNFGEK